MWKSWPAGSRLAFVVLSALLPLLAAFALVPVTSPALADPPDEPVVTPVPEPPAPPGEPVADDSTGLAHCTLIGSLRYTPALTLAVRPTRVDVTGIATGCLDLGGEGGTVRSGEFTGSLEGPASTVTSKIEGDLDFTWKLANGKTETSTIHGTTRQGLAGIYLFAGAVIAGRGVGSIVEFAFVSPTILVLTGPVPWAPFIDPAAAVIHV